ncbi:MAG: hypothetical protein R3C62_08055 [Chloroflexota bacterium]
MLNRKQPYSSNAGCGRCRAKLPYVLNRKRPFFPTTILSKRPFFPTHHNQSYQPNKVNAAQ